jgi:hypothetical protein
LARVSRKDKIPNHVIRVKTGLQNYILNDIKTILHGHVQRVADNRWSREVLEWIPPGRRM